MQPADAPDVPHPDSPAPGAAAAPGAADIRVPAPREHSSVSESPPVAAAAAESAALSDREAEILAFEKQWWKHAGAKEQAIRDTFGLSATRYYQLLNALLDNPAAMAREPVVVARLRRLRSTRARTRRR